MNEKTPRALPRDVPNYHARQADHLRSLADAARTGKIKKRLLQEAEEHETAQQQAENVGRD